MEFTAEHVRELAARLPELMGGHRGGRRTGMPQASQRAAACLEPTAEMVAGWAQLRAHRPTPRSAVRRG